MKISRRNIAPTYLQTTPVRDISDLKQRVIDTWGSILQSIIDKAVDQRRVLYRNSWQGVLEIDGGCWYRERSERKIFFTHPP